MQQLFRTGKDGRILADSVDSRLRIYTIVRLRWIAVLGQLVAILVVSLGLGFSLPVGMCLIAIALSAWLNVFLAVWYPSRHRLSVWFATLLLAYDIVQLTVLLYLTGGIDNPFTMLMAAPITVSAATLPLRNTVALGLMALAATGLLVLVHEPLPWYRGLSFELPLIYKIGSFAAVCASTTFLALYAWRLTKESRRMSAAATATDLVLAREQKLHALDGLAAAAAHELGTPLSTISVVTKELEHALPEDSPLREDIGLLRSQALRCREILQKLTRHPGEEDPMHGGRYAIESYLQHHGEKLVNRFDTNSYLVLSTAMNHHDVGRNRGGMADALAGITSDVVIAGISTDRLYPLRLQYELSEMIPQARGVEVIASLDGHDAFLTETEAVGKIVRRALLG